MSRVLVPLACGFEEIEAVTIIDVLRRAEVEVLVASLDATLEVKGANSITVLADMQIKNIVSDELDMIILPGGWDGTYALADDENVQRILKEMDRRGQTIAAICAAPFALNRAGVLKERYTCYPSVEEQIDRAGYEGEASMIVEDKNIITSRGPATAICFALEIVKKLKGLETYEMLREGLLATYCEK